MGGKSTTSTQSVSIPPEVMARYNAVNTRAEDVAATPFQQYGGNFVAPLTPTQQAGVQNTSYASGQAQPYYGAATGLTLAGAQDVGKLTGNQIGQYMDPFVGSVVQPTLQALQQQQGQERSQLQTNAIKAGAYGGDRAGLERANLARQQGLGTAQAIAPLLSQAYGQAVQTATGQQGVAASDLARRMQAGQQIAGLGTAAQAAGLQGAQAQLQAGQVEQQTQQADLTAQYQQFLQQRGYPFQVAQFLANIAMGTGALSGSTTTTEQPGGLFSDERLKHDAKRVGQTDDGLPIYTFEYNGDNKTHMGVMAQDVEKKHPDIVGEAKASDGHMYKTVDYGKLGAKERAYGGGLGLNSMGGVVSEPGAFARGGYALGGGLISDVEQRSMMANMKQPLGMYQQAGLYGSTPYQTPYGPGLGIRGDAVPVPTLVTAGRLTPQESGLKQALGAYQQVKGLGEMGSGIYDAGRKAAVGSAAVMKDGEVVKEASKGLFGSGDTWDTDKGYLFFGKGKAYGGLVRGHYATQGGVPGGGGLPYESMTEGYDPLEDVVKQGSQQHYSLAKPGELPKRQEPLKDVMQTGMQMYSAGKMGSAAIDKGKELAAKMGSESMAPATGQIQTDITAMPVARPAGLGAPPINPDAPAAGSNAVSYEAPGAVNPVGTYTIPGTTNTVTPGLGVGSTPPAPAGLVPETAAIVPETASIVPETAAVGEGLGAGLGAAEVGAAEGATALAGGAEALGAAGTAAAGIEEALPLLLMLLKRGGRANAHHYANGGPTIADYSEEADMPALGSSPAQYVSGADPLLRKSESGGNLKAENEAIGSGGLKGHFGALQFGQARLLDAIRAGALPEGTTPQKFMDSADLQKSAEKWHFGDLNKIIDDRGFGSLIGKEIKGIPVTRQGLINVGHLGGPGGLVNFVESGGKYDPADVNKTRLSDYLRLGYASENGGAGSAAASKAINQAAGKPTGLAAYLPSKKTEGGGEETDWKRILVPLATGIAGVASAPTRNLGTALAMGLGAGAQSYANLDKQQADIENVQAEAKSRTATAGLTDVQAQVGKLSLYPFEFERGFGWVLIDRSDPANTKRRLVYDQNGKPLTDPNISADQARSKMGSLGEVIPSTGGASGTGKAETTASSTKSTDFDPAKIVTKPVDESTLPIAKPIPGIRHISTQIPEGYMPTDQPALSRQLKENPGFGAEEFKKIQTQEAMSESASKTLMQLDGMKRQYKDIPPETLLTGTKYAPQVLETLKTIKGVANAFGGDISADLSNATAAAEWLQKEQFRLGTELQKGLGREPGFILQQMVNANPGANNTAGGFARIASGMEQAALYEQDKAEFLNNHYTKFGHLRDAEQLFKKLNPIQHYVDRATYYAIPDQDREYLTNYYSNPDNKNKNASAIKEFDKRHGTGSAKIVLGVR